MAKNPTKKDLLNQEICHIDITTFDARPFIEAYEHMAFQARNLAKAAKLYDRMLADPDCAIILCLAGSLFSAGLRKVVYQLVKNNMVDAIVSTGAIIVDQDFFEALGFKHYVGIPFIDDKMLRQMRINRIYDTFMDEEQLRECDMTIAQIADEMKPGPYSSREYINEMGRYLKTNGIGNDSVVLESYTQGVPIFVPAFSDCSAGFGLVFHQYHRKGQPKVTIDSAKDFLELTKIKTKVSDTGLFMMGGGVPKNFAQDITIAAEIIGQPTNMHKYAVQVTVADERDGGLSGSTLKEAHSWGKVDSSAEQIVFCEATIAIPLIANYAYHKGSWRQRHPRRFNTLLDE